MKTFRYKNYRNCFFYYSEYKNNGRLFLGIKNKTDGFIADVTINIPEFPISNKKNIVFIKNYSENEGMMDWLINHDFIERVLAVYQYNHVVIPLVELNVKKIDECLNKGIG